MMLDNPLFVGRLVGKHFFFPFFSMASEKEILPLRSALSGKEGFAYAPDYRNETVLASFAKSSRLGVPRASIPETISLPHTPPPWSKGQPWPSALFTWVNLRCRRKILEPKDQSPGLMNIYMIITLSLGLVHHYPLSYLEGDILFSFPRR